MSEEQLPYHQQRAMRKAGLLPPLPTRKERKPISKVSPKRAKLLAEEKKAGTKNVSKLELDKWFNDIKMKHWGLNLYCPCMECGALIRIDYARAATAHLLPKKTFKSVATHPLNYLILGAGCGCHYKTDRVDKFIKMKIFPEAARRIKIMLPLLPIDELRHISNQLMIALDNTKTD